LHLEISDMKFANMSIISLIFIFAYYKFQKIQYKNKIVTL